MDRWMDSFVWNASITWLLQQGCRRYYVIYNGDVVGMYVCMFVLIDLYLCMCVCVCVCVLLVIQWEGSGMYVLMYILYVCID